MNEPERLQSFTSEPFVSFSSTHPVEKRNRCAIIKRGCSGQNICSTFGNILQAGILTTNIFIAYSLRKFFYNMYDVIGEIDRFIPNSKINK